MPTNSLKGVPEEYRLLSHHKYTQLEFTKHHEKFGLIQDQMLRMEEDQ